MSAVEELRLLKAQISDVARVCNCVARGDLTQKITDPVWGGRDPRQGCGEHDGILRRIYLVFNLNERICRSID